MTMTCDITNNLKTNPGPKVGILKCENGHSRRHLVLSSSLVR